jgi:hypothetical protein
MQELRTKPGLLRALEKCASRAVTVSERSDQRVSFIMGSLDEQSKVERSEVERYVAREMGTTVNVR